MGNFLEALGGDKWKMQLELGKGPFPAGHSMGKGVEGRKSLIVWGRARMLLGLEHGA